MVVPVSLDPGRNDPRSPYYEEPESVQRRREREAEREEAEARRVEKELRRREEAEEVAGQEDSDV